MSLMLLKIVPVVLTFLLGFLLRRIGLFSKSNADLFQKLFFHVALPALILLSVPRLDLSLKVAMLPLIASLINFTSCGVAYVVGRRLQLDRPTLGVFIIGSSVMNTGFTFPFVLSAYGPEGMAFSTLFDFGNAAVVLSFIYYLACRYGSDGNQSSLVLLKKFLASSPLITLAIAVVFNLAGVHLPEVGIEFLKILGGMTTPLMMLSLGIYFDPRICRNGPLGTVIALRMLMGLLLGTMLAELFDLHGLIKVIVLLSASAPSGVTTLIFATMENLDKDFAASVVSYSTLIGLFLVPLFILLNPVP
jgi:predicted permease